LACRFSAPAKVILFGEHWVVHGGLALAAAVGLRAYASAERSSGGSGVMVCSRELGVCEDVLGVCGRLCWLRRGFEKLAEECGGIVSGLKVDIESDIPLGAGLGSSAAVATAVMAASSCALGCYSAKVVWEAAFEAEKAVHGNPSGVDNTVSLYGGFIAYRRGGGFRRVKASLANARLVIVDSGVSRSTGRAVELFGRRFERLGALAKLLFELQERIVEEAMSCIGVGDVRRLGELMDVAHGLLNAMGVSHPALEEIVFTLRALGAYGAKLTGAGLGGSAIALFDGEKASAAAKELRKRGYRVWLAELGVEGLRRESES
jgi:mevalonate kinase